MVDTRKSVHLINTETKEQTMSRPPNVLHHEYIVVPSSRILLPLRMIGVGNTGRDRLVEYVPCECLSGRKERRKMRRRRIRQVVGGGGRGSNRCLRDEGDEFGGGLYTSRFEGGPESIVYLSRIRDSISQKRNKREKGKRP